MIKYILLPTISLHLASIQPSKLQTRHGVDISTSNVHETAGKISANNSRCYLCASNPGLAKKSLDEEDCENDNEDTEKVDHLELRERLRVWFKIPVGVDINKLRDEFYDMMLYATQFISLVTLDYQMVWWRLLHSPNCSNWSNALALS